MTAFVARHDNIAEYRVAHARVLPAQPRSVHLPNLGERRAALVRDGVCARVRFRISAFARAFEARLSRSAAIRPRRFRVLGGALRSYDRWLARLRPFL